VAVAMGTFDALASWYVDRSLRRVLEVREGQVVQDEELGPEEVDRDEDRFVEIPAVTTTDEHEWLEDFQDLHGSDWPGIRIDERAGANQRFLKALRKAHPDAHTQWSRFRGEKLRERAAEWLLTV
jgi:hypothetical protein